MVRDWIKLCGAALVVAALSFAGIAFAMRERVAGTPHDAGGATRDLIIAMMFGMVAPAVVSWRVGRVTALRFLVVAGVMSIAAGWPYLIALAGAMSSEEAWLDRLKPAFLLALCAGPSVAAIALSRRERRGHTVPR